MRRSAAALLVLVVAALFPRTGVAQLSEMRAGDLRLVYLDATQGYLAPHVARTFFNALEFHEDLWGWEPSEPVTVILLDLTDRGNASAGAVPRNLLILDIAPLSFVYEIISANERMNWLMNHELVHIATVDGAATRDLRWRKLFQGKVRPVSDQPMSILYTYLTAPRDAAPRWYHEGIAVFVETWMAGGIGRAQGAWDEMVFRSMVRDSSHFYDPLGLVSEGTKIDFQVEVNSYLYGTRFMSYLAYTDGPDKLVDWVSRHDGSRAYYASQFEQVYGKSVAEAWADWVAWEHEFQQKNLDTIRQYPITQVKDLSERALGSVSRAFYDADRGEIYAGFNFPGVVSHLGVISVETGEVTKLADVKGPVIYTVTDVAYDETQKKIYYTTDNLEYRDLRVIDPATGESQTLLKDARIGDLAFNPADRSIWGVRHFNGYSTLVRIPLPYADWQKIHSWAYGNVIHDLDISPDGHLLSASIGKIDGSHILQVMPIEGLMAGDITPVETVDFGTTIPSNFVFSPDGRYLFGSTYYTGASNIFRYELATDEIEAVSNTETGLFRPIPLEDGSLIVFRYTGDGFVPGIIDPEPLEDIAAITFLGRQIVERYPVVESWAVGSPAEVHLDELDVGKDDYRGFGSLGVESVYPILQGYKDTAAIGVRLNLSDPVMLNRMNLLASYSPDTSLPSDERLHLEARFERYDWRATLNYNHADFYDLFGPTKRSLKGYSAEVGWDHNLVYDEPRRMDLHVDTAYFGGLDQVPLNQNIPSPYEELLWAEVRLDYGHVRSSLGHVDDEKGIAWRIAVASNYVNSELLPRAHGELDLGFALPLRHSSIWLRSSAGAAAGDRDNPFANFYFGGFGNNWVDHRNEKRYRDYYAFPGLEINEVAGKTYAKTMLELNLPPLRFEELGSPGFYLTWARAAVFASGLVTDLDDERVRREVGNVGLQVDFRFDVMSRLPLTLSIGYATAFEEGFEPRDEIMVSLKIL